LFEDWKRGIEERESERRRVYRWRGKKGGSRVCCEICREEEMEEGGGGGSGGDARG
jgi:hypothetical protein